MTEQLRILYIEDNPLDRRLMARMLGKGSRKVLLTVAETLERGLECVATEHFDCALVDLNLPDGNGLELVESVPLLPSVVLTGDDNDEMVDIALLAGAQDYLIKGRFDVDGLLRSIRYAIERMQAQEMRDRLRRTGRLAALGRVAGGVAHEINNPNTFVLANLRVLQDIMGELGQWVERVQSVDEPPGLDVLRDPQISGLMSECGDIVSEALVGSRRVSAVVGRLHDLSNYDGPRSEESTDLNEAIRTASTQIQGGWGVPVTLELTEDLPAICGDKGRVIQLVGQLMLNAFQAVTSGGEIPEQPIVISTALASGGVRVIFADMGPGVPLELHERIFEPFFTTRGFAGNLGLGLALVSEVVHECGGRVEIDPSPGPGTRVNVFFPLFTA
jgi:signal transduction histidine kinase